MSLTSPVHKARVWVSSLLHSKNLPRSAEVQAPYFSQFMSAELVEDYIEDRKSVSSDPNWQKSGALTADEYERWTWCDCGIACFKMVLAARGDKGASQGLVELAKEAEKYGAFKIEGEKISPLHYAEFCAFVRERYDLKASAVPALSIPQIKREVAVGNFVIVSVHPSIRHPEAMPPKRGGHLVLVVGYDDERGGLYLHNPSGYQSVSSQ